MQLRIENKINTEKKLNVKLNGTPEYLQRFYYSLNMKSHTTKERYIEQTLRFLHFINEDLSLIKLNEIDAFLIERYMSEINYYQKNGNVFELAPAAKAIIYSSISAFCNFLVYNGYIEFNPFDKNKINRPKIQEKDVVFLTPEEVKDVEKKILNGAGSDRSKSRQNEWKYRDFLLFRIPVVTGIRVTALSEISINDIDIDNQRIKVTEKGNINKYINLDDKTCSYLEKWLIDRENLLWDDDTNCVALFISNQKKKMCTKSIRNIIAKYTDGVTDKHITPHKLRSTCGTNLYQKCHDIYLVADVLGHKTTAPTKRYTKIFDEDKKNAINLIANMYDC